jgi:hypothetical protein
MSERGEIRIYFRKEITVVERPEHMSERGGD